MLECDFPSTTTTTKNRTRKKQKQLFCVNIEINSIYSRLPDLFARMHVSKWSYASLTFPYFSKESHGHKFPSKSNQCLTNAWHITNAYGQMNWQRLFFFVFCFAFSSRILCGQLRNVVAFLFPNEFTIHIRIKCIRNGMECVFMLFASVDSGLWRAMQCMYDAKWRTRRSSLFQRDSFHREINVTGVRCASLRFHSMRINARNYDCNCGCARTHYTI